MCAGMFERSVYTSIKDNEKRAVVRECLQKGHCEHFASETENVDFFDDEILVPDFEPRATSHPSINALHLAVLCDNVEITKWLLQSGSLKVDTTTAFYGDSPLHLAVLRRNLDLIKLLVCYKYEVDLCSTETEQTPALLATLLGEKDILDFLIRCGANVNRAPLNKRPPIFHAVKRDHLTCLQLLIQTGATQVLPKGCSHNLLVMAMPRLDFLQVLLQGSDAQVNEHQQLEIYGFKYTPLLHTLRHSRTPQFRTLLHGCAFIRFISTNIQTCENFSVEIVEMLLKAGANPNVSDCHGSYLHLFNLLNIFDVVKVSCNVCIRVPKTRLIFC